MFRIKVRWIIYFFLLPISLILYSWMIASEGGFRSKKKAEKKYNKFLSSLQPPEDHQYVDKIKEEFTNWLAAKKIPIFIGYVQADPYYDEDIAKEIEGYHLQNVKIMKFAGTDFTFRECRVNKRRQVALMGYEVASESRLPGMNPIVAEEVTAWLNTH